MFPSCCYMGMTLARWPPLLLKRSKPLLTPISDVSSMFSALRNRFTGELPGDVLIRGRKWQWVDYIVCYAMEAQRSRWTGRPKIARYRTVEEECKVFRNCWLSRSRFRRTGSDSIGREHTYGRYTWFSYVHAEVDIDRPNFIDSY